MRRVNFIFSTSCVVPVFLFVVASVIVVHSIYALPITRSQLLNLRVGTSQGAVYRMFGPPKEILNMYGEVAWKYHRKPSKNMVYIIFDKQQKYKFYEIDD